MKTTLMIFLCSAALLASGCATTHPGANVWEYKSATTYPEAVGSEVARLGEDGWRFVSMSAASRSPGEPITVVILFKRHK